MLDMCKYNMASQHQLYNSSIYSLDSEEPSITNRGHVDPAYKSYKQQAQAEAKPVWVQTVEKKDSYKACLSIRPSIGARPLSGIPKLIG